MRNQRSASRIGRLVLAGMVGLMVLQPAAAQEREAASMDERLAAREQAANDRLARRQLDTAERYLESGEGDRGLKMLQTVIENYPESDVRFEALLAMGKHHLDQRQQPKAIHAFGQIRQLEDREDPPTGDLREVLLESLYLTGVAHYQMRQFGSAFPVLRKITSDYPNTVWANQAYYYIGMCHFAQGNWNKTIRALSLVGTFVDPDSPTVEYIEAGRRFYVKVEDADLPILHRLGEDVKVRLRAESGDEAVVTCVPLSERGGVFIGSIPTEIGEPVDESALDEPKSDVLQVIGGDEVTVEYVDDNTKEGEKDVPRRKTVRVVSTASASFMMGTFERPASAAYLGQPAFIRVQDVDEDRGPERDTVTVTIASRYQPTEEEIEAEVESQVDLAFREEQEVEWRIRDEVTLELKEQGDGEPWHSGSFVGEVPIHAAPEAAAIDRTDNRLAAELDDQIIVTYQDNLHIGGENPREVTATIDVVGEIDARPRVSQNVVSDEVLRAKKHIVEATAYLELARIFNSMGLADGAEEKATQGLDRVDQIIRTERDLPTGLKEEAFKLRWELYLAQEDYENAIATTKLFNELYPNSPFVDEALLGIGEIHFQQEAYDRAITVYEQVLDLETSQAKAEAQFMIAEALQAKAEAAAAERETTGPVISEPAIQAYRKCAQQHPDSEFAGQALTQIVDYYVTTKDYQQADDMLEQIFQDYPDGKFLDSMLLKWVLVAYQMGNVQKAYDKCSQLVFEYPSSPHAEKAKELLPQIEARLKRSINNPSSTSDG